MSSLIRFGRRKEEIALRMCRRHVDKVIEVVEWLKTLVNHLYSGEAEEAMRAYEEIFNREREADATKREIIAEMSKGMFHPIGREEILKFIMTTDDIAANAKSAGRKILMTRGEDPPEAIKEMIVKITERAYAAATALKQALEKLLDSPEEVIEEAERIERMEEEVDEIRVELLLKILEWGEEAKHIKSWLMLKEAIENIENLTDRVEDTGDVLRIMAVMR